jgi:hypothetical protein
VLKKFLKKSTGPDQNRRDEKGGIVEYALTKAIHLLLYRGVKALLLHTASMSDEICMRRAKEARGGAGRALLSRSESFSLRYYSVGFFKN